MVSQKARERMKEYVVERLEDSGIHVAKDVAKDCLQLQTNGEKGAYVFLHTSSEGSNSFIHGSKGLHRLVYSGNFVSNIFYKDGRNFFVLLADDKKTALAKTTMSEYGYGGTSKMISLRDKEREVLRLQSPKRLVYYQPDNSVDGGRLHEGLVSFTFKSVQTSYAHIPMDLKGYDFISADDGKTLLTRVISENKTLLDGNLQLRFSKKSPHLPIFGKKINNLSTITRGQLERDFSNDAQRFFLEQTGTQLEDWDGSISDYVNPQ